MAAIDVGKYPQVLEFVPRLPLQRYMSLMHDGFLAPPKARYYMTPDLENRFEAPYCPDVVPSWTNLLINFAGVQIHRAGPPYIENVLPNFSVDDVERLKLAKIRCPVLTFNKPNIFELFQDQLVVYKNDGEGTGATLLPNGKIMLCTAPFGAMSKYPKDPKEEIKGGDNSYVIDFIRWVRINASRGLQQKRISDAKENLNMPLMVLSHRELFFPPEMEAAMTKVLMSDQEI